MSMTNYGPKFPWTISQSSQSTRPQKAFLILFSNMAHCIGGVVNNLKYNKLPLPNVWPINLYTILFNVRPMHWVKQVLFLFMMHLNNN